ncbi:MAG: PD-(D/E)XK nuclease family protein [Pseudomonadota bacterium]
MIYHLPLKQPCLKSIADFARTHYLNNIQNLRIIVPNSIICAALQQVFVEGIGGAWLLPNIIPFAALSTESPSFHKITESVKPIEYLEQKLMLTSIIQKYKGSDAFSCNILQAESLSKGLIKLFNEIIDYEIDITDLPYIVDADSAAHWVESSKFLYYAWNTSRECIANNGMIDPRELEKIILDLEVESINEVDTILFGIAPTSNAIQRFIKAVAESENGAVILKTPSAELSEADLYSPFYHIKKLVDYCVLDKAKIQLLPSKVLGEEGRLDIEYIQALSQGEEADVIARIAMHESLRGSGCGKVAIVTNSSNLRSLCKISLSRYGVTPVNLCGESLIYTKAVEFSLLLAEAALLNSVEKFSAFLKTPYLESDLAREFEMQILRQTRDMNQIEIKDDLMRDWFDDLTNKMRPLHDLRAQNTTFASLLKCHIECISNIAPRVWKAEVVLNFFKCLMKVAEDTINPNANMDVELYPIFLRQLLGDAKHFPTNESNIFLLSPHDAALLDIDTVILSDCNEGSFPTQSPQNPWMNNKMRKSLGLSDESEQVGISNYYFNILLNKPKLYITRSKKIEGKETTPSRFLVALLMELEERGEGGALLPKYNWLLDAEEEMVSLEGLSLVAETGIFPNSISATNIELLLRNPYGFYAKKILGLLPVDEIAKPASFADFGILIHNIIGLYTQNYNGRSYDRIIEIGKREFANYPHQSKHKAWWDKFLVIAADFIEFDEARRESLQAVYAEIYGEIKLNICGKEIKVTAIADRIELSKDGELYIMDYKTGAIPPKQDVFQGVSPQLIVEALIAAEGGFKGIPATSPTKLIYIKVASTSSMTQNQSVIEITKEDLKKHKAGLYNLLEYYMTQGHEFLVSPNHKIAPKYNDYEHLARKLNA